MILERLIGATEERVFGFILFGTTMTVSPRKVGFFSHELPKHWEDPHLREAGTRVMEYVESKKARLSPLGKEIVETLWGSELSSIFLTTRSVACCLSNPSHYAMAREKLISILEKYSGETIRREQNSDIGTRNIKLPPVHRPY